MALLIATIWYDHLGSYTTYKYRRHGDEASRSLNPLELQEHVNRSPLKLPELATAHQMPYCILDPRSSALRTLGLYLPAEYRCYDPGLASKRQELEEQELSLSTSIELY